MNPEPLRRGAKKPTRLLPLADTGAVPTTQGLAEVSFAKASDSGSACHPLSPFRTLNTTGLLAIPKHGQSANVKNTAILTESVPVVRYAGHPGQHVTRLPMRVLLVVVVFALLGSGTFWFVYNHLGQTVKIPHMQGTTTVQTIAATNTILADPLRQNMHNWTVGTQGSKTYVFENGAYHITDNDGQQAALAILSAVPNELLTQPFAYTLTMQEIKGDETSMNNAFGMIMRFSQHNKHGKTITTFYSFEVVNAKGGEYQFWKYDDSRGMGGSPWIPLWHVAFGHEFHQGHEPNTCKIFVDGSTFTFVVNGKKVGTTENSTVTGSAVGMLVNLKGSEIAFSNLLLTQH